MHDTTNFKVSEFRCPCCGKNKIDQRVIDMCQIIRDAVGVPVRVNSGYRCYSHNMRVGGVPSSFHLRGLAADISCRKGSKALWRVIQELFYAGKIPELKYCILYKWGVHIDIGRERSIMWEIRSK